MVVLKSFGRTEEGKTKKKTSNAGCDTILFFQEMLQQLKAV